MLGKPAYKEKPHASPHITGRRGEERETASRFISTAASGGVLKRAAASSMLPLLPQSSIDRGSSVGSEILMTECGRAVRRRTSRLEEKTENR